MNKILATIALVSVTLSANNLAAKVYKWVDKNGKVHYSDKPFDEKSQELNIKDNVNPQQQKEAQKRAQKLIDIQRRSVKNRLEAEQESRQKNQQSEETKRQLGIACARAKEGLKILEMQRPVYDMDEKGKRKFLSDEQRQKEIAQLKQEIATRCQ